MVGETIIEYEIKSDTTAVGKAHHRGHETTSSDWPTTVNQYQQVSTRANEGQRWSLMVNNGQQWSTMVNDGQRWSTMVNDDL